MTPQNELLVFLGKETHSETKSWKSSRILRVSPNFFIFLSFFIIFSPFLHLSIFSFFIFHFFHFIIFFIFHFIIFFIVHFFTVHFFIFHFLSCFFIFFVFFLSFSASFFFMFLHFVSFSFIFFHFLSFYFYCSFFFFFFFSGFLRNTIFFGLNCFKISCNISLKKYHSFEAVSGCTSLGPLFFFFSRFF